jgi:hypothetical protein
MSIRGVFDKTELNNLMPSDSKWTFISDRAGDKVLCKCSCGLIKENYAANIIRGLSKQCSSCQAIEQKTRTNFFVHGHSDTKLYNVWAGIKRRCYNKNQKSYKDYGAKGIRMCDEWFNSFESFMEFAISNGYKEGLEVDRIDSTKNYEPSNCRFITKAENISLAMKGRKRSFEFVERNSLSKLKLTIDEIDDVIECALSGLFKNSELAKAANIDRHVLTKLVKRYGFSPVWGG